MVSQWHAYEIDENGNVNSEPDKAYTKEQQMQLVAGNSVNYAENSDGNYHTKVDSDPVSIYDPEVRKEVRKGWKNPSRYSGKENYFDTEESSKRANDRLRG
ncbi:hypothetical protein C0J00_03900 [Streptococcus pluranimalium]|uniref:DUF3114 domain-containing protein n=1 Tax=Streptococcus pluranimalium TaxID=82348 RepID=A0A2L0D3V9_9STRE|nr:hypothetical protein C0J00_03900 [Streptococcus pluranimalium]